MIDLIGDGAFLKRQHHRARNLDHRRGLHVDQSLTGFGGVQRETVLGDGAHAAAHLLDQFENRAVWWAAAR